MVGPALEPLVGRPDGDLAVAVAWALEWDARLGQTEIRSTVSDGWVTLNGTTETHRQIADAERAVLSVSGVRGVTNHLAVAAPTVSPESVRVAIAVTLARRADRAAKQVDIDVDGDVVTLRGPVRTWQEKQVILAAVRLTPGVREVLDRLYTATAD